MDIIDLDVTEGRYNMGGNEQYSWFARKSDIGTMPDCVQTDPTGSGNVAELAKVTGDIVMDLGKDFQKIYGTLETVMVKDEQVGERDGKSWKTTFELFFSDINPEILGSLALLNNTRTVWIIKDQNGRKRLLGRQVAVQLDGVEVGTGTKFEDRRGCKISGYCQGNTPAPIFEGTVKLTGSTSGSGDDSYQEIIFVD